MLLLLAGIDTTWSAIGSALWHLAAHPEDRRRLVAEPELMPTAIEELLRAYAPVTMARLVAKDVDFHGCPMKVDDWVLLPFPAANRDPEAFERSDEVVIDRLENRHAAFGLGIHRCLGSNLARLELRVAVEEFLAPVPRVRAGRPGRRALERGPDPRPARAPRPHPLRPRRVGRAAVAARPLLARRGGPDQHASVGGGRRVLGRRRWWRRGVISDAEHRERAGDDRDPAERLLGAELLERPVHLGDDHHADDDQPTPTRAASQRPPGRSGGEDSRDAGGDLADAEPWRVAEAEHLLDRLVERPVDAGLRRGR